MILGAILISGDSAVNHEALPEGLIEELPDRMDRYQFNHALGQETLSTGLFNSRRVRPYSQIGEELENVHGASVAANAAQLACHFAEAQPRLGPDTIVRYAVLGGEEALAVYTYDEALIHFQRGLAAENTAADGCGSGQARIRAGTCTGCYTRPPTNPRKLA